MNKVKTHKCYMVLGVYADGECREDPQPIDFCGFFTSKKLAYEVASQGHRKIARSWSEGPVAVYEFTSGGDPGASLVLESPMNESMEPEDGDDDIDLIKMLFALRKEPYRLVTVKK